MSSQPRVCVHCHVLPPLNGAGSLCGACWLTAPNARNTRTHTDAQGCHCWLRPYTPEQIDRFREAMRR